MAPAFAAGSMPPPHPSVPAPQLAVPPPNPLSQPPPGATPAMNGSPTALQVDAAWKEYSAPSGVKYYHNALLGQSTYTKPAAMEKQEPAPSVTATVNGSKKRTWQEYSDASSGKKYYSDGVTTTWEKPEGFISPDAIVAQTSSQTKDEPSEPSKKKKRNSENAKNEVITFDSKSEAIAAFKGLLLAKGISPSLKWNEVVKVCESDSRWGARWESCADVLSVGERRQALAEFQTKRANEIREEERKERARAKESFGQMLADILPKINGFSAHTSGFADVRATLANDERFFAVENEGMRESLFLDFCDDSRKREERSKRSKKKETQDSFLAFLKEKQEGGSLTYASTWESFLSSMSEAEKVDPRFHTSVVLPDSDRQLYFADFVLDLQNAEDDKRRRIRDARRRAEKAQRDDFRHLLRVRATEGKIFPYSRWRAVEAMLSQHESFSPVSAQGRELPRELFEEFADEWDGVYRRERSFLSRLLEPPGSTPEPINQNTTYDSFQKLLLDGASYSKEIQRETSRIISREEPVSSARLLYDDLVSRVVSEHHAAATQNNDDEESSEDEGEIIEDEDKGGDRQTSNEAKATIETTTPPTASTLAKDAAQEKSAVITQDHQDAEETTEDHVESQAVKATAETEVSNES
ncbi:MAG: hypothetical protein SGILL_006826 [Bacillariaceae sp.]